MLPDTRIVFVCPPLQIRSFPSGVLTDSRTPKSLAYNLCVFWRTHILEDERQRRLSLAGVGNVQCLISGDEAHEYKPGFTHIDGQACGCFAPSRPHPVDR